MLSGTNDTSFIDLLCGLNLSLSVKVFFSVKVFTRMGS